MQINRASSKVIFNKTQYLLDIVIRKTGNKSKDIKYTKNNNKNMSNITIMQK